MRWTRGWLILFVATGLATPYLHGLDRIRIQGGGTLVGQILQQNADHVVFLQAGQTNLIIKEDVEGVEFDFEVDKYLLRALKITNEAERIPWLEKSLKVRGETTNVVSLLALLYLKYGKTEKYNSLKATYPQDLFATLDAWKAVSRGADPTELLRSRPSYTLSDDERILTELLSVRWLAKIKESERALVALESLENLFQGLVEARWKTLEREESYANFVKRLKQMNRYKVSVAQFRNAMGGLEEPPPPPSNQPVKGFLLHFKKPPPYLVK